MCGSVTRAPSSNEARVSLSFELPVRLRYIRVCVCVCVCMCCACVCVPFGINRGTRITRHRVIFEDLQPEIDRERQATRRRSASDIDEEEDTQQARRNSSKRTSTQTCERDLHTECTSRTDRKISSPFRSICIPNILVDRGFSRIRLEVGSSIEILLLPRNIGMQGLSGSFGKKALWVEEECNWETVCRGESFGSPSKSLKGHSIMSSSS